VLTDKKPGTKNKGKISAPGEGGRLSKKKSILAAYQRRGICLAESAGPGRKGQGARMTRGRKGSGSLMGRGILNSPY